MGMAVGIVTTRSAGMASTTPGGASGEVGATTTATAGAASVPCTVIKVGIGMKVGSGTTVGMGSDETTRTTAVGGIGTLGSVAGMGAGMGDCAGTASGRAKSIHPTNVPQVARAVIMTRAKVRSRCSCAALTFWTYLRSTGGCVVTCP